jgi:dipeptidyl aminopeptidase/acylaminoacyl peptidase
MVDALQSEGVKAEITVFEGEDHGWKKGYYIVSTLWRGALEKELASVGEIFVF